MTGIQAGGAGGFPWVRMRRNRRTDWSRRMVREHSLSVDNLICAFNNKYRPDQIVGGWCVNIRSPSTI